LSVAGGQEGAPVTPVRDGLPRTGSQVRWSRSSFRISVGTSRRARCSETKRRRAARPSPVRKLEIQCADPSDQSACELVEVGGYLDPLGTWG
jgi:hypothetical protein